MQDKVNTFMTTWLGASYRTTIVGWIAGLIFAIIPVIQAGGMPQTQAQWMQVIGGALIAYLGQSSKDKTVSNAPNPAPAHAVEIPGKAKNVVVDKNNP